MAQSKYVSTKQDPKWLYTTASFLTVVALATNAMERLQPATVPNLIQWRSISQARIEAAYSHKPVLYVFSANWCGPCKKMEEIAFRRKDIANTINKGYIPVLVVDESQEKGKNRPEIDKLQKQCDVEAFPRLIVVPWNLLDGKTRDIFSTGNRIERQLVLRGLPWPYNSEAMTGSVSNDLSDEMFDMMRSRVPALSGYGAPSDVSDFLFKCNMWHRLAPSKGKVRWAQMPPAKSPTKQPTMIAFVEDCGELSDKMRLSLFENDDASSLINESCTPVLVEVERGKPSEESAALKKRYSISALPAIVVVSGDGKPSVLDGFTSTQHAMQFLRRALRSSK